MNNEQGILHNEVFNNLITNNPITKSPSNPFT